MIQAMEAVKSGEIGTNKAVCEFNVPATTLNDRRVKHGSKPALTPYLTEQEECKLMEFLFEMA